MERVLGIGGVFFKARDPKALAAYGLRECGGGQGDRASWHDACQED
jgi:hypothetical protein